MFSKWPSYKPKGYIKILLMIVVIVLKEMTIRVFAELVVAVVLAIMILIFLRSLVFHLIGDINAPFHSCTVAQ